MIQVQRYFIYDHPNGAVNEIWREVSQKLPLIKIMINRDKRLVRRESSEPVCSSLCTNQSGLITSLWSTSIFDWQINKLINCPKLLQICAGRDRYVGLGKIEEECVCKSTHCFKVEGTHISSIAFFPLFTTRLICLNENFSFTRNWCCIFVLILFVSSLSYGIKNRIWSWKMQLCSCNYDWFVHSRE